MLNAPTTRARALSDLASPRRSTPGHRVLDRILPLLTLETLLAIRQIPELAAPLLLDNRLYAVLDHQRRCVAASDFPPHLRDLYLVPVFDVRGGPAFDAVRTELEGVAWASRREVKRSTLLGHAMHFDGRVCADPASFTAALREFSGDCLRYVDWRNVCLDGGSVLGILTGRHASSDYAASDLDLFVYGLNGEELEEKIQQLHEQVRAALGGSFTTVSGCAITLYPTPTNGSAPAAAAARRVQIVSASTETIFDLFDRFDLDVCAVGFNGVDALAAPRAVRALSLDDWRHGVNFLDLDGVVNSRAFNPSAIRSTLRLCAER
ncbi:hypothetical protein JCM8097_007285 [Rhodosporidiobolus ruineniae]